MREGNSIIRREVVEMAEMAEKRRGLELAGCGGYRRYLTRLARFAGSKNWLCPGCSKIVRFLFRVPTASKKFSARNARRNERRTDFLAANLVCLTLRF